MKQLITKQKTKKAATIKLQPFLNETLIPFLECPSKY